MTLEAVVEKIKHNNKAHKPILIAIGDFGGSGKTTFAEKLKTALGDAYVVNIDDFILKEQAKSVADWEDSFERTRLREQVLGPASAGERIIYQKLEWADDRLGARIEVPNVDYLIVEGISSYHPDIASYYDYKIWVDTPIEVARDRGKARDVGNENEHLWDDWAKVDLVYQERYHPEQVADITVKGS